MTYTWPDRLPQAPLHNGYSKDNVIDVISDAITGNYVQKRRRSRVKMKTHNVSFSMTLSQLSTFYLFYELLGSGVLPFYMPDPVGDGVCKMRIQNSGSGGYTETYDSDTSDYILTMVLEEIPG